MPFNPPVVTTKKAKKTGEPSDRLVVNWLTKPGAPLARYRGQIGAILQRAKVYGWNPAEILILLASTNTKGTTAGIDLLLGKGQSETRGAKENLAAWGAQYGYQINTKLADYVQSTARHQNYAEPYSFTPVAQTPGGSALKGALTTQAKKEITSVDKWVVVKSTGKTGATITAIDYVPITQFDINGTPLPFDKNGKPIKGIVKSNGQPVTQSSLLKAVSDYQDFFDAYGTGAKLQLTQVANLLHKGLSSYAIEQMLSKRPGFKNSQIYKAHAPGIIAIGKDMFGQGWKPDQHFISQAISGNWDQGTIVAKFKEMPAYLKGPQYRQQASALSNVHMSIMGTPSQQDLVNIHEATLQGWSADEYAAWVRGTKAYKYGPEAQSYALHIADALGLITGKQATLVPGGSTGLVPRQPPGGAAPANSPRIPGKPVAVAPSNNYGVNY